MSYTLNPTDLAQFTGSEHWYRHGINRNVLYTDGAQYVAEHAGAYWLLDEIALIQPYDKRVAAEEFQVWKLAVKPDNSATLTCDDGNGQIGDRVLEALKKKPRRRMPTGQGDQYSLGNKIVLLVK